MASSKDYLQFVLEQLNETLRKKQFIFLKYILRGVIT